MVEAARERCDVSMKLVQLVLQEVMGKLVQLTQTGDVVAPLLSNDGMLRGDALRFFRSFGGPTRARIWQFRVHTRSASLPL